MNYNRRATRPDGGYYRESRKRGLGSRSRARARFSPALLIAVALAATFLAFWVFHR